MRASIAVFEVPMVRSSPAAILVLLLCSAAPALASPAGDPTARRQDRDIVGGSQVPAGKWPDAAAVIAGQPICTGTLILPDVVLTAGHCIGGIDSVVLGVNDFQSPDGETIAVAQELTYPNWESTHDVGILILAQPSTIAPRVIASGCVLDRYLGQGAAIELVGYGAIDTQGNEYTSELREVATTVTDPDCTGGRGCNATISPGGELGAGGMGKDTCFGDSGGPVYLTTEIGDFLVGVTSRGYFDTTDPCGEGGIYSRPDSVIDWIESATGETVPRATCNAAPEPSAAMITVEAGATGETSVAANDPDAADQHTYAVTAAPGHGVVTLDADGTVHFSAASDYEGADAFTVTVTDSGVPALSGTVTVAVTITPASDAGCGCRSSRGGAGQTILLVLVALAVTRRRRR